MGGPVVIEKNAVLYCRSDRDERVYVRSEKVFKLVISFDVVCLEIAKITRTALS
jgi:hypothetical protein